MGIRTITNRQLTVRDCRRVAPKQDFIYDKYLRILLPRNTEIKSSPPRLFPRVTEIKFAEFRLLTREDQFKSHVHDLKITPRGGANEM